MVKTYLLAFLIVIGLSGCSSLYERIREAGIQTVNSNAELFSPVKPWQRASLARPAMQFGYLNLDATIEDHIYFSKEATSGGRTFAGGGCGCN